MEVELLDHVNIITNQLDATANFYAEVLGLERRDGPPPMTPQSVTPQSVVWMYDKQDRPIIHLNAPDCQRPFDRVVVPGSATGAVHHVALKCSGFDEMVARLDARGAQYQLNVVESINLQQIFTHDPNNVLLELNFFTG